MKIKIITALVTLIILCSSVAYSFWGESPSWKLYKDSVLSSNELYLILDMKHFGQSIQKEECFRLRKFYSSVNRSRKFHCLKNTSLENPIKK